MSDRRNEQPKKNVGRTGSSFDPVEAALRQLYDKVAKEEIPDQFMSLLDRLEAQTKNDGHK